jgi:hypothetical protein
MVVIGARVDIWAPIPTALSSSSSMTLSLLGILVRIRLRIRHFGHLGGPPQDVSVAALELA